MLFSIDNKKVNGIPRRRQEQWNLWRGNISESDYEKITGDINDFCDEQTCFTSSFVPQYIWGDEPCRPLLDACNQSAENANFFFGLIVWMTLIQRDDEWMFKPADNEDDIQGTTYWRLDR